MPPETAESIEQLKARGAFYTPPELTNFLAAWAIRAPADRALEPSAGDGAFVSALAARFGGLGISKPGMQLVAVEREPDEAWKCRRIAPSADIRTLDFFDLDPVDVPPVDAAVGNPPFIRYHGFTGTDRAKGLARAHAQGVSLTNLASSWAHFVIHAAAFLKREGRLALVLPAELLHTDYGSPVRDFLTRRFSSVIVIAFDRLVFADAQVDAVLLLASRDDAQGLRVIRVRDESELADLRVGEVEGHISYAAHARWSAAVDRDAGKIYEDAISELDPIRLGAIGSVDIGYVSGANDFFVLSREAADSWGLSASVLTPTIRRPSDVPGLATRDEEVQLLLNLNGVTTLDSSLRSYLEHGESTGVSQRYKPRARKRWFAVPLPTRRADAFLPYMSHHGPRLVVNCHAATSSNLLHGVSLSPSSPPVHALAVGMASSLTLLSAEIEGRGYGGGVLKLETREAERLVVPRLQAADHARLGAAHEEADLAIRAGRVRDAARLADELLGLDHEALWAAYAVFRDRRLGRANSRRRAKRG